MCVCVCVCVCIYVCVHVGVWKTMFCLNTKSHNVNIKNKVLETKRKKKERKKQKFLLVHPSLEKNTGYIIPTMKCYPRNG